MGFIDWAKNIFRPRPKRPLDGGTVERAFSVVPAPSRVMNDNIELWYALYTDCPPWETDCVKSLGIPTAICREFSRSALSEFNMTVSGSPRADYINEILQAKAPDLYKSLEIALALGGVAFRPYMDGQKLSIDVTSPTAFSPIEFDGNGNALSGVFKDTLKQGKEVYTRLEYHGFENGVYVVRNKAYKGDGAGQEIALADVEKWKDLQPEIRIDGLESPLFAYLKNPQANNIEPDSNIGVSVYGGSVVNLIEQADKQWERIGWEYESGERKIFTDGRKTKAGQFADRLFENGDWTSGGDLFEPYSPAMRDDPLYNGFQRTLQRIEYSVGLSFGSLSDPQSIEKTATEILAAKSRQRQTINAWQQSLQKALDVVVYGLNAFCDLYGLAPAGVYETTYNWGDGVLDDPDTVRQDKAIDLSEVSAGLITPVEYRMKWFKETEEEAAAALQSMELVTEPENEIE